MPPSETPAETPVEETSTPPPEQPLAEPTPEEMPGEVLPPQEEGAEEGAHAPETPPEEGHEDPEPTAEELRAQLAAKDAELEQLRQGKPDEEPADQAPPQQRVSMGQVFYNRVVPEARKQYAAADTPEKQMDVLIDVNNKMLGAFKADHVQPVIERLAMAGVAQSNEIELLRLEIADPEFKTYAPKVREQLTKTDWKTRSGDTAVTDIYHRLRGAKTNGTTKPTTPAAKSAVPVARKTLKDVAAGSGASPAPKGLRLTPEQERDYQEIVTNTNPSMTRAEYYAKFKARVDQAKAQGKNAPTTYRG